ncbi:S26 family signal peptidase [Actinomadura logoneensis]|uniref:Mitochondrial inner membrane protease subunit 2 n=1 Tax=Actinomadura logoneensis TaxID=2293572 RepID=A0A372JLF9_9ACTN|nr:S26 family signal peptidase [Actinomadura logoneensis]RFU40769.1 S26 family signal peptidase [Actinomadura logoneensis]
MTRSTLALGTLAALTAVAASAVAVRRTLILTTVDGDSMEPSLRSGDRVLIRRTRRVRRGQITLLRSDPHDVLLLKRAVAVPGDPLDEEWAAPVGERVAAATVPRGTIVVLGDNRPTSWDSRHFGPVRTSRVLGVYVTRVHAAAS